MQNVKERARLDQITEGLIRWRRRSCYGMTQILPYLYVGSFRDANDLEQLREKQIKCIVSVHGLAEHQKTSIAMEVFRIHVADLPEENIGEHFNEANLFIHRARLRKESVLVHCIAGVSRSVCIVAAYLIAYCDMSYAAALAYIARKRPCANPNFGFRMQLAKYAEKKTLAEEALTEKLFDRNAFDELKKSDKKVVMDYSEASLSNVREKNGLMLHSKNEILPFFTSKKGDNFGDPGSQCNIAGSNDITFIDQ